MWILEAGLHENVQRILALLLFLFLLTSTIMKEDMNGLTDCFTLRSHIHPPKKGKEYFKTKLGLP
jgi:hypothetical protein